MIGKSKFENLPPLPAWEQFSSVLDREVAEIVPPADDKTAAAALRAMKIGGRSAKPKRKVIQFVPLTEIPQEHRSRPMSMVEAGVIWDSLSDEQAIEASERDAAGQRMMRLAIINPSVVAKIAPKKYVFDLQFFWRLRDSGR